MISLGIDPSVNGTGLAVLADRDGSAALVWSKTCKLPTKVKGHARTYEIVISLAEALATYKPDIVVIENYGFSFKRKTAIVPLAELGGVLRFFVGFDGCPYISPRPTQVKKFLMGEGWGFADKKDIIGAVKAKYGHDLNADEADAFAMGLMGLASANAIKGLTQVQREIMGELSIVRP